MTTSAPGPFGTAKVNVYAKYYPPKKMSQAKGARGARGGATRTQAEAAEEQAEEDAILDVLDFEAQQ